MFSVNNLSPHSYRSACISYFSVSLTKATYWRRLLWLTLQGIYSLSWGRQSSGHGRHGMGCSLASTLRKWRVSRGWGWHIVSQPAPNHPCITARLHLPRVSQPSQTSSPTRTKCSNIWAYEGRCTFKSKLTFVPHRLVAIPWCKMYPVQFWKSSWSLIVSVLFKHPKSKVSSENWGNLLIEISSKIQYIYCWHTVVQSMHSHFF